MSESPLSMATLEERNAAVRDRWDTKAAFWDEHMADGNQFQRELIGPALERLLHLQPGERVLDVACGNGVNARWMARLGAEVLGIDFSRVFLERAAARKTPWDERITYQEIDATDEAALLALGEGTFNAIVCSMALMDMAEIGPLLRAFGASTGTTGIPGAQQLAVFSLVVGAFCGIGIVVATNTQLVPRVAFGWVPAAWSPIGTGSHSAQRRPM